MAPVVLITGASSGLGAAFARFYAAQGATLGLVARRGELLDGLKSELPVLSFCYPADVTDARAMAEAGADFIDKAGIPDIVIANAGVSVGTLTEAYDDLAAFDRVMRVNVTGMAHTFHPFIKPMRLARRGRLVGVGSVAGMRGLPGAGAYSASKSAAMTYLESLRVELRGSGIKVIRLAPGYIDTPMTAVNAYSMPFMLSPDEAARRMARIIATGRRHAVVPWQMAVVANIMRLLPDAIYDRFASRAGRKPRGLKL